MLRNFRSHQIFAILAIAACLILSACAKTGKNPRDPYESANRKMFAFNQGIDRLIFKPTTTIYRKVMPGPFRKGLGNFFDNLDEIPSIANGLLQGKPKYAVADAWRFIFNSTLGIGGLFDVATDMGLRKHTQDMGLTFAKWGDENAPYIVLPIIGSSTIRDTFGISYD